MRTIKIEPSERYVILHADDFGMCHTTNKAIIQLLAEKSISATTLMVPCPWSIEAAKAAVRHPGFDVGIHLTLTSEWEHYKWGPIGNGTQTDTLVDEFGHFPAAVAPQVRADPEQVRREAMAQVEAALRMGVDPTHLDNHMGVLHHFPDIYLDLAAYYKLPFRFAVRPDADERAKAIAKRAAELGVLHPDAVVGLPFNLPAGSGYETTKKHVMHILQDVKPGVTEILFHPSLDTDELKAITDTWQNRRYEFDVFRDSDVRRVIAEEGIQVVGWRDLRNLQRGTAR